MVKSALLAYSCEHCWQTADQYPVSVCPSYTEPSRVVSSGATGATGFHGVRGVRGPHGDTGSTGATGILVQNVHQRIARAAVCPGKSLQTIGHVVRTETRSKYFTTYDW